MFTFYASTLPPNFGGIAYGPVVLILEKYRNDAGLHAHERFRTQQWWAFFLLGFFASLLVWDQPYWHLPLILGAGAHAMLYLLSDKYKLWSEVQAYKKQAQYYADDRLTLFAGYISKYYKLDISIEDAYQLLKE